MEGDYDGEELRVEVRSLSSSLPLDSAETPGRQLLEAEVERPPPRAVVDEFGPDQGLGPNEKPPPLVMSPMAASPVEEPRGSPRPYISRRRSSQASLNSPLSPTARDVDGSALPGSPGAGMLRPSLARRLSEATGAQ